ncbi:hypothetical protein C8R43DRAFT_940439 [Mycena crocata]|nr:hypothetical protein C8R43DRAFT_940439 [Mycena crocata]
MVRVARQPKRSAHSRIRALKPFFATFSRRHGTNLRQAIEFALLRHRFRREGRGLLYLNGRVDTDTRDQYHDGRISLDVLLDVLEVKIGHTNSIRRRRRQYRICEKGQVIIWHSFYVVRNRIIAEHLVHSSLKSIGIRPIIRPCPGCRVRHREYYPFRAIGSFDRLDCILRAGCWVLGEGVVVQLSIIRYLDEIAQSRDSAPRTSPRTAHKSSVEWLLRQQREGH